MSTTQQFDTATQQARTFLLKRNVSGARQAVRSLEPVHSKLTPDQTAQLFNIHGLIENLDASLTPDQAPRKRESAIANFKKAHDAVGNDKKPSAVAARILANHALCLLGRGRTENNSRYFDLARGRIEHAAEYLKHRYGSRCQEFLVVNGLRGEAIRQSRRAEGEQIIQKTQELLVQSRASGQDNIAQLASRSLDWLLKCDGIVHEPVVADRPMRCYALNGEQQPRPFTIIVPR